MKCPSCGTVQADDLQYCSGCVAELVAEVGESGVYETDRSRNWWPPNREAAIALIAALVVAVVFVVVAVTQ